jgi:hypothetical protein
MLCSKFRDLLRTRFTAVVRKRRASFTAVVRERPLGLQQPIDFQLSMVVIVFYLIRTGSNLYSRGVHYFCFCTQKSGLRSQKHCLLAKLNSHNQPQQTKARTAQKSSNLTEKFRRKAGYFQVNTGRMQFLQMPVFH